MPLFKFLGDFFKKVGEIFSNLTLSVEKIWDHYEPELQQAIKDGSGIVALINTNIDKAPDFIYAAIQQEFPHITKASVDALLAKVATDFNLLQNGVVPDPLTTIQNILTYLSAHTGSEWEKVSEFIANTIALFLAPAGTIWNKIGTVMWWVYQTFIKKD